jgi:hypothetical protein
MLERESRKKAKAEKARMVGRAYGGLRPLSKRIKALSDMNGIDYHGFRRRELAKLKQYLDNRYEDGLTSDTVVQLLNYFFNWFPDMLDYVCHKRGLHSVVEEDVVVLALALQYLVLMYKIACPYLSDVLIAVLYFYVSGGREALPVPLPAAISLFSLPLSHWWPPSGAG